MLSCEKKLSSGKPFENNNCLHFRESKFTGDWAEYVHWFKIVNKTEPLDKVIYMYIFFTFRTVDNREQFKKGIKLKWFITCEKQEKAWSGSREKLAYPH